MPMPTKSKADKLAEIHSEALKRFDDVASVSLEGREEALSDRRFHSIRGAQWEGAFGEQFKNRVKLEVNLVNMAVQRIVSEHRMNRISVDFLSREGDETDEIADLCDGLYRADEQDSRAEEAYDNAFEEAAGGGFGAWRLVSEYEDEYDEDDDRQRIRFEPIYDADTCVYFDNASKRQDKSDAKYAFVLEGMPREAYEELYDDPIASWEPAVSNTEFDWCEGDTVYVAEYYRVDEQKYTVFTYRDIDGREHKYNEADFEADEGLKKHLNAIGTIKIGEKQVKRRAIHKYIMSGGKVLEDCGVIAGTEIPIIPVFGKRFYVDGIERFMGIVRLAKDAQRLKNMQLSAVANIAARSGTSKMIVTPTQIAGHEAAWANDAVEDYAFLKLNPTIGPDGSEQPVGPVGMKDPPSIPQATAALLELSQQDLRDVLGNQEAGEQVETELSGRAMELVQAKLDMQSYIYMSNFAKSIRRCGEVWLSMARDLYTEPKRKMKVVGEDETMGSVVLMEDVFDEDGDIVKSNDLSKAKFDVTVDVGPTSSTRRSATVRALSNMLPLVTDPQDQKVIGATIMRNMEGEGISSVREYYRKQLVAMGVEEPTDEDLAEAEEAAAQPQEPNPDVVYLQAKAEEAQANAARDMAETEKVAVEAEKIKAETAETVADTQVTQQQLLRPAGPVAPR